MRQLTLKHRAYFVWGYGTKQLALKVVIEALWPKSLFGRGLFVRVFAFVGGGVRDGERRCSDPLLCSLGSSGLGRGEVKIINQRSGHCRLTLAQPEIF